MKLTPSLLQQPDTGAVSQRRCMGLLDSNKDGLPALVLAA